MCTILKNRIPAVLLALCLIPFGARGVPGEAEPDFLPEVDGVMVRTVAVQADGRVLVGGDFSHISGAALRRLARLNGDGTLDSGFLPPGFYGEAVSALAVLPDGRLLVGGDFTVMDGENIRQYLVRLNADGSLDPGFDCAANGPVSALAVQADGRIVVAGEFTGIGGGLWARLARLEPDGLVDSGYMVSGIDGAIRVMVLSADGRLVIGGEFTKVCGLGRQGIARLETSGFPDPSFHPGANGAIESLAVQADGKLVVGGQFTLIGGEPRQHLARLAPDGTVDPGFNPEADESVVALALQADGKILAGGWFEEVGGLSRRFVARILASGTVDSGFDPGADLPVVALALQGDGRVLAGGGFSTIGGLSRGRLARLENEAASGGLVVHGWNRAEWLRGGCAPEVGRVEFEVSADGGGTWSPLGAGTRVAGGWELTNLPLQGRGLVRARGFIQDGSIFNGNGQVEATAVFPAYTVTFDLMGKGVSTGGGPLIQRVAGGEAAAEPLVQPLTGWSFTGWDAAFDEITADLLVTAQYRRLPGFADEDFSPSINGPVYAVAVQPDGKWLAAGAFTMVNGESRGRIARFHADGSLDMDFAPFASAPVMAMALQEDGKLVVGGTFLSIDGESRARIARLHPDGSVDAGFNPGAAHSGGASWVTALAVLPNGKILVGGNFGIVASQTRNGIAQLLPTGALDPGFNPNANSTVECLLPLADGKIMIGGAFTAVGGQARNRIARLMADGTPDAAFNPGANDSVLALALQADGRLLVGGAFTELGGQSRQRIGRLGADGAVDTGYVASVEDGQLHSLVLQTDGNLLAGGSFTLVNGGECRRITRLGPDGSLAAPFGSGANDVVYAIALGMDGKVRVGGVFTSVSLSTSTSLAVLANELADDQLTVDITGGSATWLRGGTAPEIGRAAFELSDDGGATWLALGDGARVEGGWKITGLQVAGEGKIRGRGSVTNGCRQSGSGIVETVTDFTAGGAYHRVVFATGDKGTRIGGGALAQMVTPGGGATAPEVAANYGWIFSGWDVEFGAITEDLTVTAQYVAHGAADVGFAATANGTVFATAVQPDGRILVAGQFTTLGGQTRNRIARLQPDGTLDADFNPNANGTVFAVAVQPDGKILIGGGFTSVAGGGRSFLARLHADGTLDSAFNTPVSGGQVYALALQNDGMILLGGAFTSVGGQSRSRLARLRADGSLDTGFTTGASSQVSCITLQPDGKILVGGWFTSVGSYGRGRIARLLADGSVDTGFNPYAGVPSGDAAVHSIAVQTDGNILLGGSFTLVGGVTRPYLARVTASGALDGSFYPAPNGQVLALALQADGAILAGGEFTTMSGVATARLTRLTAAGARDAGFLPNPTNTVYGIGLQADGRILVGGAFGSIGGSARTMLARLWNAPATADLAVTGPDHAQWLRGGSSPEVGRAAFELSVDGGVNWHMAGDGERTAGGWQINILRLAGAGKLRVCGLIRDGSVYSGSGIVGNETDFDFGGVAHLVKFEAGERGSLTGHVPASQLLADGGAADAPAVEAAAGWVFDGWDTVFDNVTTDLTVTARYARAPGYPDTAFNHPNANGTVYAVALQADGKILLGGSYTGVGGQSRPYLARLHPDGTLDTSFNPGSINSQINTLAIQPDGKILIGGWFTQMGGQPRQYLARLNPDGSLDSGFNPSPSSAVNAILTDSAGRILIGGNFGGVAGQSRSYLARILANGTLDPDFRPNANNYVRALAIQPDGRIIVGGDFSSIGGAGRSCIARLETTGAVDPSFAPNANSTVYALAIQPDGKILMGGAFTALGVGTRYRVARLTAAGGLDGSFAFVSVNHTVRTLALQTDGNVLIGGEFTNINNQTRYRIGRLGPNGSFDAGFDPSAGDTVHSLVLQADGRVLAAGAFQSMSGQTCNRLARIANHAATTHLTATAADRVEWLRGGASPETGCVTFESSPDGNDPWTALGTGTRANGGWELMGLSLTGTFHLRARAHSSDGSFASGVCLHEEVAQMVLHSVVFDLGGKGERTGGGALAQAVVPGQAAVAPEVVGHTGWTFAGWEREFDNISGDTTIAARYEAAQGSFYAWLVARALDGEPAGRFAEFDPSYGAPRGLVYAFGNNLVPGDAVVTVRRIGGRNIVEIPALDPTTVDFVSVRLEGSTDPSAGDWSLPLRPATDASGKPAGKDWFEIDGEPPPSAFFRLSALLK